MEPGIIGLADIKGEREGERERGRGRERERGGGDLAPTSKQT